MNSISQYRTFKVKLKDIVLNNTVYDKIINGCKRSNIIISHVYQFIRLYILSLNYNNIPIIDEKFIKVVFKLLSFKSGGPKVKDEKLILLNLLNTFYENTYSILIDNKKFDTSNLSQVHRYACTDIKTNIDNNIKMHFKDYLFRYVNSSFKDSNEKIIEKETVKNRPLKRKELYKFLIEIKNDLLNNTNINETNKDFILKTRTNILSFEFNIDDIEINPQKYFKHLILMNREIKLLGKKQFQFFPLRTDFNLKYMPIDSVIIVDLLFKNIKTKDDNDKIKDDNDKIKDDNNKTKNYYNNNITESKDEIWNKCFNMKHKIFNNKTKTYTFNYMIYTDGYGTSIQFIEEAQLEKENIKKNLMKQEKNKIEYAGLEKEEIKIIKAQKLIETKNKELKFKEDKQKIKKELIKKLKEDAQKLKEDNKKLKEDNKKFKKK